LSSVEVGHGVYVVVGGAFPKCNTLVAVSGDVVVVDPGCPIESLRALLKSLNLELRDIDTVVLSHIHPDHITHTVRLNRVSKCRIAANEVTAPLFNDKEKMKEFLGFTSGQPVRHLWEQLVNDQMYGALDQGHVDEVLHNGDKIALDDITLRAFYTKGHLPDHMCLEIIEPAYLFAADVDCTDFGPFYGHPNSSIEQLKDSIKSVKERSYSQFISGHLRNPLVQDYRQALDKYLQHFDKRDELVVNAVAAGAKSVNQILERPIIYPPLAGPVMLQFERWMIEHHVASLIRHGKLVESNGNIVLPRD